MGDTNNPKAKMFPENKRAIITVINKERDQKSNSKQIAKIENPQNLREKRKVPAIPAASLQAV